MLKPIVKLLISPIIILQGLYVKRVTPRLPEAKGERSGISLSSTESQASESEGQAETSLLVLGDSAAAGVGVEHQSEALLGHILDNINEQTVRWQLLANTGDNCAQLLKKAEAFHQQDKDLDFQHVVISIGVNDVTGSTPIKVWVDNLTKLINVLQHDFNAQKIYFSALPPMHAFPALPQPLRWLLGQRAVVLNKVLRKLVAQQANCFMVEASFPLEQGFIADDGFHPGADAYKLWGTHVAQMVKLELSS